eukprot:PhM_4_TR7426/c0_g1_i1/m.70753
MPPKKADKVPKELISITLPEMPAHLLERRPERWVRVFFRLVTPHFLNDSFRVPTSTTLHMLEQKIVEHHGGSISRLQLWKEQVHPRNVLHDFTMTLTEVFKFDESLPPLAEGEERSKQPLEDFECVVYYDFSPHDSDCPLLLRSPKYEDKKRREEAMRRLGGTNA